MTYEVTVEPTGDVVEVEDGQTLLDAALRQGVWLPFACGHGTCGTCKVQITDGYADQGDASSFALMDVERDEGKVLACCCLPESDMVIEADIDVDDDFEGYAVEDFKATVTEIIELSPTIRGIIFELDRNIQFQAGQYINISVPGVEGNRAFSIANAPSNANTIELHVRKVPNGAATTYIHESLKVGNILPLSGPYGQFFIRKSDDQGVILIAGGSGLSSPQSMAIDLLESGDKRPIYLFQGARDLSELYNREILEKLAEKYDNFHYIPALDNPAPEDNWEGYHCYVHEAVKDYFKGRCSNHKAYLCGPPVMIDAAITMLMQARLFERDIYMEHFLTTADGAKGNTRSALFKKI